VQATRVIAVDLGGTKILAGLIDAEGQVEAVHEDPTPIGSQTELLDALVRSVEALRTPDTHAVGFGVPARVDARTGRALGAVNIPLGDLNFAEELSRRLGLPVGAVNDAGAAALAELRFGAGRGLDDLVMLTLGTGVGGGVVIGGQLYRGWAELGHMVIVENGEPCQGACHGRGHVEAYCSGNAADRVARIVLGPSATAYDLVEQRHPALAEIGVHLGTAIGSLINIFGPQAVVIGGGFGIAAGDQLLAAARPQIALEALPPGASDVPIVLAELGSRAGLVGAALVAFEALAGF
jgi:glucokinase